MNIDDIKAWENVLTRASKGICSAMVKNDIHATIVRIHVMKNTLENLLEWVNEELEFLDESND